MKVAILGTRGYPSYYGGFETAVRHLAPYLADRGWDVTVYGRRASVQTETPTDPRVRSVLTRGIESKSLSTLSYGISATVDALRSRPDVALIMNVANGPFVRTLESAGIPTVVNVDGIEWERDKWGWVAKRVFEVGANLTARHARTVIYDAHEIAKRWEARFNRTGEYIPYGGALREELTVPEGLQSGKYILVVARFVPENSIPQFLDAVEDLAKSIDVVIVGSSGYGGELEQRILRLTEASTRVSWLGHVADDDMLHALWQHAGVYFHGHTVGGTNPALVQAMACGAVVLAVDTPYNREVLGPTGRYCAANGESIRDGIVDLLGDSGRQNEFRVMARKRAASHFTWEGVCERYEQVLRQAVESGGR